MGDISLELKLHDAQMQVYQDEHRFVSLAAGRRFGKSKLAGVRAVTSALSPKNSRRLPVWLVAPVFQQAKQIYWRELLNIAHPVLDKDSPTNVNEGYLNLINGVQIGIKGADRPDTMRGVGLFDVILDEYADMKPVVWDEIIRPALSDVRGRAMFIGTPKGRNHYYDLHLHASGGVLPYRSAAQAGGDPDWAAYHFTSLDNPFLPEGEVEAAQRTLSSSAFRQEYLASFETGGADVFQRDWIKYNPTQPEDGEWYVAVDLAGFADVAKATSARQKRLDQTAIAVVKITPEGKWWVKRVYLGRWGVEETARRIIDILHEVKPSQFGIEKGALYQAVVPYLTSEAAKKKMPLRVIPLSHENKAKEDRVVWALQGRMEHGNIEFAPNTPEQREIEDQIVHFPSRLVHDDGIESLAYIEQLAKDNLYSNFGHVEDEPYWEPIDDLTGF